ncbi:MAG: UPF0755 protein [Pseudohongiellaceae bacterium]
MTKLRFISLIFFTLFCSALTCFVFYQSELKSPLNLPDSNLVLEIKRGDSLNKVLIKLTKMEVLSSSLIAKIYAREKNLANRIKTGEFLLKQGVTIPRLFELITSNQQISYNIQFIEGSTFDQVKRVLASTPKLIHHLEGKSDAEILKVLNLGTAINHLEGQFYPDTYTFVKNDSDIAILKRAHLRLQKILKEEWQKKDKNLPLKTPYDALILASIIEKETGAAHERSEISGVFIRRLNMGMRLQTDPTVIYGLGERYAGNLTRKHLKETTPYNTYRINGLPPTPIAIVGQDAIHAAINPKLGKSLFFVAKGDGTHQFSETMQAHNIAVQEFQLKRREDYRSTQ